MSHTCCASPDERHAAYCITTKPARHTATMSDEDVLREMHKQADVCVAVCAMPEGVRHRPGPKGEASPAQAAALNAVIALHFQREAAQRGLL